MKLHTQPLRRVSTKQAAKNRELARVRPELLRRASYRCQFCQARDRDLHGHHAFGRVLLGLRWVADLDVLVCLCDVCHERVTNAVTPEDHALVEWCREQSIRRLWARLRAMGAKDGRVVVESRADNRRLAQLLTSAIERAEDES